MTKLEQLSPPLHPTSSSRQHLLLLDDLIGANALGATKQRTRIAVQEKSVKELIEDGEEKEKRDRKEPWEEEEEVNDKKESSRRKNEEDGR